MSTPLEDYALLADLHTGPLVSREGSMDWLCFPRFDSPAVFCSILGDEDNGRWKLSAVDGEVVSRRYIPQTFVLETEWRTPTGRVRVTDFLPPSDAHADLVRRVECLEGTVQVEHDLRIRFDYGRVTPWIRRVELNPPGDQPHDHDDAAHPSRSGTEPHPVGTNQDLRQQDGQGHLERSFKSRTDAGSYKNFRGRVRHAAKKAAARRDVQHGLLAVAGPTHYC